MSKKTYQIIHECYENETPADLISNLQLDEALNQEIETIIIEPLNLGNRTINWLTLGKYLRRFSTSMGVCCLLIGYKLPNNFEIYTTCGFTNMALSLFYFISWNSDLCIKYKHYEINIDQLPINIPRDQIRTNKPVILVKDKYYDWSNMLHFSIASLSFTFLTYKLFKLFLNPVSD